MQKNAKKAIRVLDKFKFLLRLLRNRRVLILIPDGTYLKLYYWMRMGRKLDLHNPKTFNEKIQWLKLYDRNPVYAEYADKYEVRKHVEAVIGEKYLIPLLGVWDDFDAIDFGEWSNRFVLKCTHDSGGVIVCKNKAKLDWKETRGKIEQRLAKNYYDWSREWAYKNIQPRIICEEFIESESDGRPNDYKIHCFNGEPRDVMVCTQRESGNPKFIFFDKEWNRLTRIFSDLSSSEGVSIPKPKNLDEMFEIAAALSKGIPFVRVDLYFENDQVYFGELTLYPQSGYDAELLPETERLWGEALALPR